MNLTKTESNPNHYSNYQYQDYSSYIKNKSYHFSKQSNIDIDEFISESGLIWTKAMQKHKPERTNFIAYFKIMFHNACLNIIRHTYNQNNGGKVQKISLDKQESSKGLDQGRTLHSMISIAKNAKINYSDIALLSDSAKQLLKHLMAYNEPIPAKNLNKHEKKKLRLQFKKYYWSYFSGIAKKVKNYDKAIKEICELLPNAKPAINFNTFPIILTK